MFRIRLLVLAKLKFQVWLNSDMFELRYRVSVRTGRVGSARLGSAQLGSQIKLRDQLRLINYKMKKFPFDEIYLQCGLRFQLKPLLKALEPKNYIFNHRHYFLKLKK